MINHDNNYDILNILHPQDFISEEITVTRFSLSSSIFCTEMCVSTYIIRFFLSTIFARKLYVIRFERGGSQDGRKMRDISPRVACNIRQNNSCPFSLRLAKFHTVCGFIRSLARSLSFSEILHSKHPRKLKFTAIIPRRIFASSFPSPVRYRPFNVFHISKLRDEVRKLFMRSYLLHRGRDLQGASIRRQTFPDRSRCTLSVRVLVQKFAIFGHSQHETVIAVGIGQTDRKPRGNEGK